MADLTDTKFLGKATFIPYFVIWALAHIWQTSRLDAFSFKRLGQLRTLFTYLFFMALAIQFTQDVIETHLIYNQGQTCIDLDGNCSNDLKNSSLSSSPDHQLQISADYLNVTVMSLLTMCLFILQAFWDDLVERVTKQRFMQFWEYKFYCFTCAIALPLFPCLRLGLGFSPLENMKNLIPQLIFAGMILVISILSFRTYLRLRRIIDDAGSKGTNNLKWKLAYFQDMNCLLTISIFIFSISLLLSSVDPLLSTSIIQSNNFFTDLLETHMNLSILVWYVSSILIFHPYFAVLSATKPFISAPATPIDSEVMNDLPTFNIVGRANSVKKQHPPPVPVIPDNIKQESEKKPIPTILTINPRTQLQLNGDRLDRQCPAPEYSHGNLTPPPRPPYSPSTSLTNSPEDSTFNDQSPLADNMSAISSEIGIAITTDDKDAWKPELDEKSERSNEDEI